MVNDDHGNFSGRSEAVLAVTIVMIALSTAFTFFRLLSRFAVVKKTSIDDYFIILAWLITLGLSLALCYGTAWGLGRHEENIPPSWQSTLRKADYAFTVLYQPALMAVKTSILAFYLTLPTANRIFRWACIATLVVVNAGGFALTMVTVFQCRPIGATFDSPTPASAHCTDVVTIYLSSAPLNIITDLALFFLPIPILTAMRLPRKQKIILIITFGFGIFVAAVDVVRIAYLQSAAMTRIAQINEAQTVGGSTRDHEMADFSWYASFSFMWTVIEVNVSVMVACVPGLKPLVSRFLPRLLRDPGDAPSKTDTPTFPDRTVEMREEHRVPSLPEDVRPHDFVDHDDRRDSHLDRQMGFMEFLTTPDSTYPEAQPAERTPTALTNSTRHTGPDPPTFFDFVNMGGNKSMLHLTVRESLFPITVVTILFFIWGFEYGLLDVLNQQFQRVAHMTSGQTTAIHSAYYAGYFFGPLLVGRLILKYWGFKACYSIGLGIYGCGTLIFWPAAVLTSFPAFFITNFIVGFGLSILEVSANPFIVLCGPPKYGEIRLNLSQGVQAIGSVIAPLIAAKAFFHKTFNAPSLVDTQWAYLGISLATILLAVVYHYVPLPEATDDELEDAAERIDGANKAKVGAVRIIWITLAFGVFSQFCYVGGQEVNATSYDSYLAVIAPTFNATNYMAIAHTAFAAARFLAAGLGFWVKPRILMLFFFAGAIVFEVLAMNYQGGTGVAVMTMVFFMEGPLFSLIFAQTLRGLGRHTKLGSVLVTAAISGGAVFSPIANPAVQAGRGAPYSLVVAVAVFAAGTTFAVGLNGNAKALVLVDPIADATSPGGSRAESSESRASRTFSWLGNAGKKNQPRQSPAVEYVEGEGKDEPQA